MKKYLIVNADDFGITPRVSEGIITAHKQGIVTSTTVMANMPAAADAIQKAQTEAPDLGLGLHFNLSFGAPVLPAEQVPSLLEADGTFGRSFGQLQARAPRFQVEHLTAELHAQFDRFVALAGGLPDHMDSHHAITYWHPHAFDVMLRLAAEHGLPVRSGAYYIEQVPVLRQVYEAVQPAPRWPGWIDHEPDFFDDGATLEALCSILNDLEPGVHEFICHPGYPDDLDEDYAAPRAREVQILTDPAAREIIAQQGIELITFAQMPG